MINLMHFVKISKPYDHKSAVRTAHKKMATTPNNETSNMPSFLRRITEVRNFFVTFLFAA